MTDTVRDLNHYYTGTIIGMNTEDGIEPVNVLEFVGSDKSPMIIYDELTSGNRGERKFVKTDWMLTFPQLGVFNVEDTVVFVERSVRRQWRKSYRTNLVRVEDLFRTERNYLGQHRMYRSSTPQVIEKIYKPEYFSFSEAISLVKDFKRLAAAFSDEFYIGSRYWSDLPVIGHKKWDVATTDGSTIFLKKKAEYLKQSLEAYTEVEVVK